MINAIDIFKAFAPHRDNAIVVAGGRAGRHWSGVSDNDKRDLALGGAMGHTTSATLGVALGQPDEKVVLFDSEGALLMNLGIIATVAGKKPKNFFHFLLDNECYATTGGQPVPNSNEINYSGMAKEAGYASAYHFDDLEDFTTRIGDIMKETGPVFISVKIEADIENLPMAMRTREARKSRADSIVDLQSELGISAD